MGGKTGLSFGLQHPDLIGKMIMVDISPCAYDPETWPEAGRHAKIMQSLLDMDLDSIRTREEADSVLEKSIHQPEIRMFLLKNLKRQSGGKFYWGLNLPVLANSLPEILAGVVPCTDTENVNMPEFPLLFIKGACSSYLDSSHLEAIHRIFPCSLFREIPEAGHWIHAEQPQVFLDTVRSFLGS
jgi:pimeloyl-ACP methyl ester carboxylesterase